LKSYQQYNTSLKLVFALNLQNQLIDKETLDKIPYTTSKEWTKDKIKPENIIGTNLENKIILNLKEIKNAHHKVNKIPLKMFNVYCEFTVLLTSILKKKNIISSLKANKDKFINFLENNKHLISYAEMSQMLAINSNTLYSWKHRVKHLCDFSPILLCLNRHPNQASKQEVEVIQEHILNPLNSSKTIHAIWANAFRNNFTKLSEPTWYSYNKMLGFRKKYIKGKKGKYEKNIAECVNQIWHADITVFKTLNNVKYYIYTVMDNYSRYILNWKIETKVCKDIRLDTIKEAMKFAFGDDHHDQIQFITDGGPENDNLTIKEFMTSNSCKIKHDIALQTIIQSNSLMEAFYSSTKYKHLYNKTILDYEDLVKEFNAWLIIYQTESAHYALGVYTPEEAYYNKNVAIDFKTIYMEAAIERRKHNKAIACVIC
jgi:putative transposase